MRWRVDISYDGSGFAGWARQPELRTVQGDLEDAITRVLRLDESARLVCAGRTDAGVHARGQVAHLDLEPEALTEGQLLQRRLNRILPTDVVVRSVSPAPPSFDARFAALWRRYAYRIRDGEVPADPLHRGHVVHLPARLDLDAMNAAAADLLGLRDFGAFCRRREGATSIRTLLDLTAQRVASGPLAGVVVVTARADAFCHSMVRSLVGALTHVGSGVRDRDWLQALTRAATRDSAVPVLPAYGLTLEEVGYPAPDRLAMRAREARTVRDLSEGPVR